MEPGTTETRPFRRAPAPALRCRAPGGCRVFRVWFLLLLLLLLLLGPRTRALSDHPRALGLDYDDPVALAQSPEVAEPEGRVRLADFPAGAASGTLIHHVLETLDFTDGDPHSRLATVKSSMLRHGMAEAWASTLSEALPDMLGAPLGGPLADFSLSQLARADRIDELEFTLPVSATGASPLTAQELGRAFSEEATDAFVSDYGGRVGALGFPPLEGHLRGFIDLVFRQDGRFYLVDYKSNRLGAHLRDYDEPHMQESMLEHDYVLQYHLMRWRWIACFERVFRATTMKPIWGASITSSCAG